MNPKLKRPCLWLAAALTAVTAGLAAVVTSTSTETVAAQSPTAHPGTGHILVVNSYHPGFGQTQEAMNSIRQTFSPGFHIDEVYLDTKNHPLEPMFQWNKDLLAAKFKDGRSPDIVIAFDDNATIFTDWHRNTLFPNAPIVFAGVNSRDRALSMSSNNNATGVLETTSVKETVRFAQQMNRGPLRRIRVIANGSQTSQTIMGCVALAGSKYPGIEFETINMDEHSFEELESIVESETRADTAFLFAAAYKDAEGVLLSGDDLFGRIGPISGRPIYVLLQKNVLQGATGGFVGSKVSQSEAAIAMVKDILSGTKADDIPPLMDSPNFIMLSEPLAHKYELRIEELPESAVIHNRVPDFFEEQRGAINAILAIVLASILVVILLQISNIRVQRGLREINKELENKNADLEKAKDKIEHHSLHDALTGLPNRRYAEREICARVNGRDEADGAVALFFLDLDDFKPINDTSGHHAGDRVLKTVAQRLLVTTPEDAFVARIGGDEFIVLAKIENTEHMYEIGNNLIEVSKAPIRFGNNVSRLSASVGVVSTLGTEVASKELLRRADIALYRAKEEGKGGIAVFEDSDLERLYQNKELSDDIVRGVEELEFIPFFQPQVSMRTGRVVGVEALARWDHPERGVLSPFAFVDVAERLGILAEIDKMILEKACEIIKVWKANGIDIPRLSVNVSAKRLSDSTLIDQIEKLNLSGTTLVFELLESIYLDNADGETKRNIARLRKMGIEIEVDDFGTGHASIVAVMNLKPKRLKIAREFIAPIGTKAGTAEIVRNLIEMAKNMGVGIIAEGVETVDQMVKLSEMGCDIVQGYCVKHPIPADEIPGFVCEYEQRSARKAS